MSFPIVPAVVIGGIVYVASTHDSNVAPPPNPNAPPPGSTIKQIHALRLRSQLTLSGADAATKMKGPVALDPTLKPGSYGLTGGAGQIDPKLQAALDAGYAAAKAKFDTLDDDAKATAAGEINKEFNLTANTTPPALTADKSTSWETVASIAGAAAGASVGAAIGGPFGAKVGALLGAYLGVKIEDWLASLDVGSWFPSGTPDQIWAMTYGYDASTPEAATKARAAFNAMSDEDRQKVAQRLLFGAGGITHF